MGKILKIIKFIPSLPKTVRFNFKYFPWRIAMRLPVFVSKNVLFKNLKGKVVLHNPKTGGIRIGFDAVGIFDGNSRTIWNNRGLIEFLGQARIGHGSKISVGGNLEIGDNFCISAESTVVAENSIFFGKDVLIAWDVLIMDTDLHYIGNLDGEMSGISKPIRIGDHVWIGARSTILKGVSLAPNIVIAASSTVSKSITTESSLVGGVPAKIIKHNIRWSR